MTAKLVSLTEHVVPGEKIELAVVFTMVNDWHIYWQNPGDAGMATFFDWQMPDGFEVVSELEPAPVRYVEDGITTFIHEEEAIYLFTLQSPETLDDSVRIWVNVDWLECKSICLTGFANLSVKLPVSTDKINLPLELIEVGMRARAALPMEAPNLTRSASIKEDELTLTLRGFHSAMWDIREIDFFPEDELVYDISVRPQLKKFFLSRRLIIPLLSDREEDPIVVKGVLAIRPAAPKSAQTQYYYIDQTIKP